MELRRLTVNDYDALLELLDSTFAKHYGRPMDFQCEQPKMWIRDEEHMRKHFGVFEDDKLVSVTGVYPLEVIIGNTPLLFATTGNVATHPEYTGRGYFSTTFDEAMRELERIGADAGRLGGARQRYSRYGYEPAAISYKFTISEANRKKYFGGAGENISFKQIMPEDTDILRFCHELYERSRIFVRRSHDNGERDMYLAMCTKHSTPYLAMRGDEPVGYLCAYADNQFVGMSKDGKNISELRAKDNESLVEMICAWQLHVGGNITFTLPPHEPELLRIFADAAQAFELCSPSRFKVINFKGLADALMKLKASYEALAEGEYVLEIEEYGKVMLYSRGGKVGAKMTDAPADMTLDMARATRLLFGPLAPSVTADVPSILKDWLPLPLSWDTLDYV